MTPLDVVILISTFLAAFLFDGVGALEDPDGAWSSMQALTPTSGTGIYHENIYSYSDLKSKK